MIKNQPGLKISAKTGIIIFIAFSLLITIPVLKKYYDYLTKFKQTEATVLSIKDIIIRTYEDSDGYRRTDEDSDGYWRTDKDSDGYRRTEKEYVIEVEFLVDGQKIKKEIIYYRYPKVGQKIEIRYNPQNPYEVTTESTFSIIFGLSFLIFFWILLAIIPIKIYISSKTTRNK